MSLAKLCATIATREELERLLIEQAAEADSLRSALSRMVDMMDFHYRDECIPKNETDVPLEGARAALTHNV